MMKSNLPFLVGLTSLLASLPVFSQGATPANFDIPPAKPTICAIKTFDADWTDAASSDAGVYTIGAYPGGEVKLLQANKSMTSIRAAVKKNSTMYCISASADGETAYYTQYSTSTWTTIGSTQETDIVNIPTDLTYDPVTDNVYGWFFKDDSYDYGYYRFCSFNLSLGEAINIKDTEREGYAIAADGKGTIYMLFGAFDYLATIDPKTGDFNRIKSTKLYPSYYNSMVYDETTDRLFAIVTSDTGSGASRTFTTALHSIDPHTGDVTTLMTFPSQQGYVGLFMMPYTVPDNAPDAPTGITVDFPTADSTTGTVRFTAPAQTANGSPLRETTLMAVIEVGGVEYVVRDIQPGASVASQPIEFAEGNNTVKVTMTNATDRGGSASITVWAGIDIPAAVSDLLLSEAGGMPQLSWTAPATGLNGGKIDPAGLSYQITRRPDNAIVATAHTSTTFTDMGYQGGLIALSYDVTPSNAKGTGPVSTSNKLVIGGGYTIPFTETFASADAFELWTVENTNGGSTWTYDTSNSCAKYNYDPDRLPGDDWLISPSIELKAGEIYRLSYSFRAASKNYPESFEVKIGTTPTSAGMTTALKSHKDFVNTSFETASTDFSVETDGKYYLGFHNNSAAYMYYMLLDNISLTAIDSRVPASVDDLTVTAGANGSLEASVSFTVPTTDTNGDELESISKVDIFRDSNPEPVYSLTQNGDGSQIKPGQTINWLDTGLTESRIYTYRVSASTNAGAGNEAQVKVFVGIDVPGAVVNLRLLEIDGDAHLTWEKPATGANGGWYDPSSLTYSIYRYTDYEQVATNLTGNSFTDQTISIAPGKQELVSYVVFPYTEAGRGSYAESPLELFGEPYQAPFTETFPASDMTNYPWISVTDVPLNQAWTLDEIGQTPFATDQNSDRGMATFHSAGELNLGIGSYFLSPKISIESLENPELGFWMYHSSDPSITTDETLEVVAAADGGEFTVISPVYHRDNGTTGWTRYNIPLTSLSSAESYIRVGFKGTTAGGFDIYVDNITISERIDNDLELSALDGPKKIAYGSPVAFTARITNVGSSAMSGTIALTENGIVVASKTIPELQAGKETFINLDVESLTIGTHILTASVSAIGDSHESNNTLNHTIQVVEPVIPAPFGLSGIVNNDGTAVLSWLPADSKGAVSDDIESYPDWIIDGIGDWTTVDRDHDITYFINNNYEYPNRIEPKAWQVCNASTLGIDIWDEGTPHSGNKMLMAIANQNYVNDDWLISPQLNGMSQTIRFYAKTFTTQNTPNERLRVLYSLTDTDPANFIKIHLADYIEVPDSWTEYSYHVPQEAKYFAINCVSDNAFALFIDDLSFNDLTVPATALSGYEILRNGQHLLTVDAYTTQASDAELATLGEAVYTVRAIYDDGSQSEMSESITLTASLSGTGMLKDSTNVGITVDRQTITVTGANGLDTRVLSTDGKNLFCGIADNVLRVEVPTPGIYIVLIGNHAEKVIVK